jgi:carbamoyltransferase
MISWGINALNHGSSLAVFENNELRSFDVCPTDELDKQSIYNAFHLNGPNYIYWYERPWLKKLRQLRAGQWHTALDTSSIPTRYLNKIGVSYAKIKYTSHHASHAAAGYYTSPFNHCAVVVLDAIGEFE